MIKQILLIMSLLTAILSCSYNKEEAQNDQIRQEIKDRTDKLSQNAKLAQKVYTGTIRGVINQKIEISFYQEEVKKSENAKGQPVYTPELRAKVKQIYPVEISQIYEVRELEVQQKLILSRIPSPERLSCSSSPIIFQSLTGFLNDNKIEGEVLGENGVYYGQFSVELSNETFNTPSRGDITEYKENLYQEIQAYVGTYVGIAIPPAKEKAPFEVLLNLAAIKDPEASSCPKLVGSAQVYDRLGLRSALKVDYLPNMNPTTFVISTVLNSAVPSNQRFYFSLELRNGNLVGLVTDAEAIVSQIKLQKR